MEHKLKAMFNPAAVAVVGVSRKKESVGTGVLRNLLSGGYEGEVYPVNPKMDKIMGLQCYSSIAEIKGEVDLVVIAIPRNKVLQVVEECVEKRVKSLVVISAGFKEADEEGEELEEKLAQLARDHNMLLLGPNCLGVINTGHKLNASFAAQVPEQGNISFISQSGAVGVYALEYASQFRIGFAKFVSLGNKALCGENDVLEALLEDEQTKVILTYLEGFEDARQFFELADKLRKQKEPKPLVVLKVGKSKSGQRAAQSHTGALAASDEVLEHLFTQYGIVRVDDLESLFNVALVMSSQPLPAGDRLCIITNAGGPGIITADAAESKGLKVPELSEELQQKLKKHLPRTASLSNPIDLVGDATAMRYKKVLQELIASDEADILLFLCTRQLMTDMEAIAEAIGNYAEEARGKGKTMLAAFADFDPESKVGTIFDQKKIPYFHFGNNAIGACAVARQYSRIIAQPSDEVQHVQAQKEQTEILLEQAVQRENKFLTEPEVYQILQDYGLEVAPYQVLKNKEGLKDAAEQLSYPLVAKVVSVQVVHKSDAGGVVTDIRNEEELLEAYDSIHKNVKEQHKEVEIEGILLQQMLKNGAEFIIGARYSNTYGHILMFGVGGIFVEVLKDVTFRRVPVSRSDAKSMIEGIRAYKILEGVRGKPAVDKEALADTLLQLSQLVQDFPQIEELDINPVFGFQDRAMIADARLIVR